MIKRAYILFAKDHSTIPKIYKTKRVVDQRIKENPNLQFSTFDSIGQAEIALADLIVKNKKQICHTKSITEVQKLIKGSKISQKSKKQDVINSIQISQEQNKQINQGVVSQGSAVNEILKAALSDPIFRKFLPSPLLKSPLPNQIQVWFDGASKFNPGPASLGYYGAFNNVTYFERSHYLGIQTNNQAEFTAIAWAMMDCGLKNIKRIQLIGDSRLVINAMKKQIHISSNKLLPIFNVCKKIEKYFDTVEYLFVMREYNQAADKLANKAFKK